MSNEMDVLNEEMFTQYHRAENLENPIDTTLILNELASLRHKNWIMILVYESDEKFITSSLNSLGFDRLKEFHHVQYPGAVYLYDFGE